MMAAGIAVEAFAEELLTQPFRSSIAVSLMLLAAVISVFACLRWFAVERALRSREPLPVPWQVPIVSLVLFLGTLVFTVVLLN